MHQLSNGHWSIDEVLLAWVDSKRKAGLPDSEIISQLVRVTFNISPIRPLRKAIPVREALAVTVAVKWPLITNAIVGVIEGASGEWLCEYEYISTPDGVPEKSPEGPLYAREEFWACGGIMSFSYDDPDHPGQVIAKKLDAAAITKGLAVMLEKVPRRFADLYGENDDAITHDAFMQCALLGDIIYG